MTIVLILFAVLLLLLDCAQTVTIARNPSLWSEVGWARHFIGEHPRVHDVYLYFFVWVTLTVALAFVLPAPLFWIAGWLISGIEGFTVIKNYKVGISPWT